MYFRNNVYIALGTAINRGWKVFDTSYLCAGSQVSSRSTLNRCLFSVQVTGQPMSSHWEMQVIGGFEVLGRTRTRWIGKHEMIELVLKFGHHLSGGCFLVTMTRDTAGILWAREMLNVMQYTGHPCTLKMYDANGALWREKHCCIKGLVTGAGTTPSFERLGKKNLGRTF